jgi:hypothetical protein
MLSKMVVGKGEIACSGLQEKDKMKAWEAL